MDYDALIEMISDYYERTRNRELRGYNLIIKAHKDEIIEGSKTVNKLQVKSWVEGRTESFDNSSFEVLLTNGHSPGSVTLYTNDTIEFEEKDYQKVAFVGDLAQRGQIGKTFVAEDKMMQWDAINSKILSKEYIDEEYLIFPGHGNLITFFDIALGLTNSTISVLLKADPHALEEARQIQ